MYDLLFSVTLGLVIRPRPLGPELFGAVFEGLARFGDQHWVPVISVCYFSEFSCWLRFGYGDEQSMRMEEIADAAR